jgi:hypothetical protein
MTWKYIDVLNECIKILLTISFGGLAGLVQVVEPKTFVPSATKFVFQVALPCLVIQALGIGVDFYSDTLLWNFLLSYLVLRAIFLVVSIILVGLDRSKGIGHVAVYWLSFTWISTGVCITGTIKYQMVIVSHSIHIYALNFQSFLEFQFLRLYSAIHYWAKNLASSLEYRPSFFSCRSSSSFSSVMPCNKRIIPSSHRTPKATNARRMWRSVAPMNLKKSISRKRRVKTNRPHLCYQKCHPLSKKKRWHPQLHQTCSGAVKSGLKSQGKSFATLSFAPLLSGLSLLFPPLALDS